MIAPHLAPPSHFISEHGPFPLSESVIYAVRDTAGVEWWNVKEEERKDVRHTLAKLSRIRKEVNAERLSEDIMSTSIRELTGPVRSLYLHRLIGA